MTLSGQTRSELFIMRPTGDSIQGLPEMQPMADTSEYFTRLRSYTKRSFVKNFLEIYDIYQNYVLYLDSAKTVKDPAYLAITKNEGGFPRYGFNLRLDSGNVHLPGMPYIDLSEGQALSRIERLMSFSQLFPHEVGHVFLKTLALGNLSRENTYSVNIHFFSLITDYSTAFNEGFAEHIENVSRHYETDPDIIAGIRNDSIRISSTTDRYANGFRKDMSRPWRMGFYKSGMILWYQELEDLKRYQWVFDGSVRYHSTEIQTGNLPDRLSYRNAGVEVDRTHHKNLVQLHSTEGIVSAFFTALSLGEQGKRYLEPEFYRPFLSDSAFLSNPSGLLSQLQNQFIKYFYVFRNYVGYDNARDSQLTDFVSGYIEAFPDERDSVLEIYQKVTGITFISKIPPPLWILNKDFEHRLLALDPFGGITVPVYTFDLNAADEMDLMTLPGLSEEDAHRIVSYRDENGLFSDFNELLSIPGIDPTTSNMIASNSFNRDDFEANLEGLENQLNMTDILKAPIKYLIVRIGAYYLLILALTYWVSRTLKYSLSKFLLLVIRYFSFWTFLVILALILIITTAKPELYFIMVVFILLGFSLVFIRKSKIKVYRALMFNGSATLIILLSMF